MKLFLLTVYALAHREVVRFYRQRNRVIGALAAPLMFWFLIGSGMGGSFRYRFAQSSGMMGSATYLQYFFPGTLVMIVLFTAIFSSISIIEDRREGFLQAVLVAPGKRSAIALGKMMGGAALAWMQALLFLMLFPTLGLHISLGGFVAILCLLAFISLGMTGLGFLIAWKMDSVQGFHAIMNLLLMPMWFLSGSLFPSETAPFWLRLVMLCNPLTYGVTELRHILFSDKNYWMATQGHLWTVGINWSFTIGFSLIMFILSTWICSRQTK